MYLREKIERITLDITLVFQGYKKVDTVQLWVHLLACLQTEVKQRANTAGSVKHSVGGWYTHTPMPLTCAI